MIPGRAASRWPGARTGHPDARRPASDITVQVTRVLDGDTFEVAGGARVRVLGIDSCEMSTPAGKRARAPAQAAITRAACRYALSPRLLLVEI